MGIQDMDFMEKACLIVFFVIGIITATIALGSQLWGDKRDVPFGLSISICAFGFIIIVQNIIFPIFSSP